MRNFSEVLKRGRARYGDKFSDKSLSRQFVRYFESGERIMLDASWDGEHKLTGTVGVTTGWVPCFILMRTSRSMGSSVTLGDTDKIIAVKRGRKYVRLSQAAA